MTRLAILIGLSILTLGACQSATYGGGAPSRPNEEEESGPEKIMHLYRIDIDPEALAQGARLLFDEPPPQNTFGLGRRAQGFFSVSDRGSCRIEVGVAEAVVALNGQTGEQRYTLLKFFGRASADGTRATTMAGETANVSSLDRADEVHFFERGNDKITVQAYRNGKPSAYKLHFQHAPLGRRDVPVPWRVSR